MEKMVNRSKVWAVFQWVGLGLGVMMAWVPTWLVMQDRWVTWPVENLKVYQTWHAWGFGRVLPFPDYFLIIFGCLAALLGLSLVMRRSTREFLDGGEGAREEKVPEAEVPRKQRQVAWMMAGGCLVLFLLVSLPMFMGGPLSVVGYALVCLLFLMIWGVREMPLHDWWAGVSAQGDFWLSLFLAQGAWVGVQVSLYTHQIPLWFTGVTLGLAFVNLIRFRKQISPVFWVFLLALGLFPWFINAWWFSVVGDEFAFYDNALWISKTWSEARIYWFQGTYVYGTHPFFATVLQAIFMALLGPTNFSWRFSNLYLSALSLFFFYDFWRRFLSPKLALWSVLLLAGSHYLFSFGKIGYNNLQGLLAVSLVLWASGWAVQSKRWVAFVAVGLAQVSCFYTFTGALIALPLPWLFFLLYDWPKKAYLQTFMRWAVSGLTLGVFIFPLFWQKGYWDIFIDVTAFSEGVNTLQAYGSANKFYGDAIIHHLVSPLYLSSETHFVASSLIDPLSGVFFLLGLTALVWALFERSFLRVVALTFAYILVALVITSSQVTPSPTRAFFLLPWLAVITALGLAWVGAWLKKLGVSEKVRKAGVTLVFVAIFGMNLWQAYPISYQNMGQYQTLQVYYLKAAQVLFTPQNDPRVSIILVSQINEFVNSLRNLLDVYNLPYRPEQLTQAYTPETLNNELIHSPWALIVVSRDLDESTLAEVNELLETTDKTPCPVNSITGLWLFDLWVSPEMEGICEYMHTPPFE